MHEAVANHFSLAVSADSSIFLVNPFGVHFSKMRASDLLLIDSKNPDKSVLSQVDVTAMAIHAAMHKNNPHARCIVHLHPHYATALSVLEDPTLPPVDQTACRFFNRVAVDTGFSGMGLGDEAERLSKLMGNKPVLMMGSHGLLAAGSDVATAFDLTYYYERACRTYVTALSTGQRVKVLSDAVAEKTALQWEDYEGGPAKHLHAIRAILDQEEPAYKD